MVTKQEHDSLDERVQKFLALELPGQPRMMHVGTSSLVRDLDRRVKELEKALSFAQSVIKSGEPWTDTCEEIIGGALGR